MYISSIIITGSQHHFVGRSNSRFFAEFNIEESFGMLYRLLEHPIDHSQSKHIFTSQYRFLIQTGLFQRFDSQLGYFHRNNIIVRQRTVFGPFDMFVGKGIDIHNNSTCFFSPT